MLHLLPLLLWVLLLLLLLLVELFFLQLSLVQLLPQLLWLERPLSYCNWGLAESGKGVVGAAVAVAAAGLR